MIIAFSTSLLGKLDNTSLLNLWLVGIKNLPFISPSIAGIQGLKTADVLAYRANQPQISDQNPAINKWIWQLRDAIDEADDVLDEFEYMNHKQKLPKNTKETKSSHIQGIENIGGRWVVNDDGSRRIRWAIDDDQRRSRWAVDDDQSRLAFYEAQVNASLDRIDKTLRSIRRMRMRSATIPVYSSLLLPSASCERH
ncbi:hypothetical protein IEQ34_007744 [Dendrobium chrysotoxum]|uniref:Disease resistance N-terminal domain-containing protein n=1 Tax=Dendrobium chrysotoxum TaxID=161865 RepID=A0AAV7H4C6_DENCH|nr:hypothetical protein IEQ34_007744 [Dendrobium chrysotoxum]